VSINQIGIAIWGWILGGLLIGYKIPSDTNLQKIETKPQTGKTSGYKVSKEKKNISVIPIIIGGIVGVFVVAPPYSADVNWRSVLLKPNATNLETGAKKWPLTPEIIVQSSEIYSKNKLPDKGLELAKFATEKFPHDFRVWYFYYKIPDISSSEKALALKYLRELDPLNPDYK
jgi:hypothetical protein